MHIATAFDANYVQHAGVMLCSLFLNNPEESFHIHLFHHNVNTNDFRKLIHFLESSQHKIHQYNVSLANEEQYVTSGHISRAAYLRVFIPTYIDDSIEKILYLDADIVVSNKISNLWKANINAYCLAAVENVTPEKKHILSHIKNYQYFNSGVLLINLKKWRKHNIMQETIKFIEQNQARLQWHDQDALNAVLYGKWFALHPKYNMQGALFMDEFENFRGDPDELQEAIRHPVIIHYSTPLKPWHYLSFHPYTKEYFKYLASTPWKDFKPTDKNLVRFLRKTARPYLRRLGIKKIAGKHLY
uniref:Glycosyltransferase family 8 protein n=1 Tax=Roseihalotalea indica TaxID=2867963 RepID=A0AA49JJY1_9BACT|nr:glycosyltransferase family 8 protein [Tunicatimonas sp. TK19036]